MKLIFLYGPPASGKLTIAKALADRTGISLFHNHMTFDLAEIVYTTWSPLFFEYCAELRIDVFKRAAEVNKSIIFTFCYIPSDDHTFVEDVVNAVGIDNIHFIKIDAPDDVLLSRVANEERKKFSKISEENILSRYLTKRNCHTAVPNAVSLEIDSATATPEEAVDKIIKHYDL